LIKKDFTNPFSDYGNIVYGDRFINRHNDLLAIENRVIRPREAGNLAIFGDYRIGKSSLVFKSIMEHKKDLKNKKCIPVWINLATFDHAETFFHSLVESSYNEIENEGWLNDNIELAARRVLQIEASRTESYGNIQRYFQKVRQADIRVIFVLDEFDHARYLFKGDVSGFQGLRELSYRPEWRVAFVTTSRRSIQNIELQSKAISTLDGIFLKHYLGMFDEHAVKEYFERLSSVGIAITPDVEERVLFYCGGHPYLLEMLGYELVELFRVMGIADIDRAAKRIEQSIIDHYEHMLGVLKEDKSLNKIMQILFGPVIDAKLTDAEELQRYGLIHPTDEGNYVAFSEHFQIYLKMIERQIDLWPLWRETEIALRHIITEKIIEQYGEDWVEKLCKAKPNVRQIFEKCKESQLREEKSFGNRASRNLIDFTYPGDLFKIMFAEWQIFVNIFRKDTTYWGHRAQLLSKIRNPLAHNREQLLSEYERQIAEGYCKEILSILGKY